MDTMYGAGYRGLSWRTSLLLFTAGWLLLAIIALPAPATGL